MPNGEAHGPLDLLMVQLLQSGIVAQNNFITAQKIIDYDTLEYKRRLSVSEVMAIDMIMKPDTDTA